MQLRFATAGAAEGWARVRVAAGPYLLGTEASVLHDMEQDTTTLARYVVVEDGEVVGIGRVRRRGDTTPSVMVMVHPEHQGRGVGRLLFDRLVQITGPQDLDSLVNGDDRSLAVAAAWGFSRVREHRVSSTDPRTVAAPAAPPPDMDVRTLEEVGPRAVWECHDATAQDDPSGLTARVPFEHFLATDWTGPLHRADLGHAVVNESEVVAYSQVDVAGDRAWSTMTGCRRDHRGRGLATLAKARTLRALADAGVIVASTGNDEENRAMLAINDRLGYRPAASTWSMRRPALDGSRPDG
ncbi:MAG TPA: GNAT family N-acetyltransferase [Nocardioides sp.]|uniref:GNAT family N-acetyltransferase n=1 Tax=Nocardioides sp. TaxID=35761 RepID=UPI002D7E823F|nr:GNAT family N-acetyltransferase [Nocardioides sp.]HET6654180.1 GNAT family N-acetyltransferase [Nocardioides sp.]